MILYIRLVVMNAICYDLYTPLHKTAFIITAKIIAYFIYHFKFIPHGLIRTDKWHVLNVSSFIAQLVRASHRYREVTESNPLRIPNNRHNNNNNDNDIKTRNENSFSLFSVKRTAQDTIIIFTGFSTLRSYTDPSLISVGGPEFFKHFASSSIWWRSI